MVISRAEGAPWSAPNTPVLSGDLDATGWGAVIARDVRYGSKADENGPSAPGPLSDLKLT